MAANAADVYDFLHSEAGDYFTSVTADAAGNVSCMVGETAALKLNFDNSAKSVIFTLANTAAAVSNATWLMWSFAYKTSKGIYLYTYGGTNANSDSLFITKNDAGNTVIAGIFSETANDEARSLCIADIIGGTTIYKPFAAGSLQPSAAAGPIANTSGGTVLVPLPTTNNSARYTPDLFILVFSQYPFTPSVLMIGGKQYVYNGILALKE